MFETSSDFDDSLSLKPSKRPLEANSESNTIKKQKTNDDLLDTESYSRKSIVKRKFPGPAGLLFDRANCSFRNKTEENIHLDEIPCSQSTQSLFESDLWKSMLKQYKNHLNDYNIKRLKTKAMSNGSINEKTPFFAVIIQKIEHCEELNPKIVVKDESDEISGTIKLSLYEKYSDFLKNGSVIVLRECSVLTIEQNHYLIITPKSLVAIYSKISDDSVREIQLQTKIIPEKPSCSSSIEKSDENNLILKDSSAENQNLDDIWEGVDLDALFDDF